MLIIDTGALPNKDSEFDVWRLRCYPFSNGKHFYIYEELNSTHHAVHQPLAKNKFGCSDLEEVITFAQSQECKGVRGIV